MAVLRPYPPAIFSAFHLGVLRLCVLHSFLYINSVPLFVFIFCICLVDPVLPHLHYQHCH